MVSASSGISPFPLKRLGSEEDDMSKLQAAIAVTLFTFCMIAAMVLYAKYYVILTLQHQIRDSDTPSSTH